MAIKKATANKNLSNYDALSQDAKEIMDRAVKLARTNYWCHTFVRASSDIFNVPESDVVDLEGFSCDGYNREGFNQGGFNRDGFDTEGYSQDGFNKNGYDREGFDRYGMNKAGLDRQGRDKYKLDVYGYDKDGYDAHGMRARRSAKWYADQAAKPDTEFRFDGVGRERPKTRTTAAKKTTPAKVARAAVPPQKRVRRVSLADI